MESMVIDNNFWNGKRVFLTGHTGFKGSWLTVWLSGLGAEVHGYALNPDSERSIFQVAKVGDLLASDTRDDIRNLTSLKCVMSEIIPEVVIHMAAQPLVRESYQEPIYTLETNVLGTAYLLEAVRSLNSQLVVLNITTDKCYENREWHWGYRENEALGGFDPYSSSKACSELVSSAYQRSYFQQQDVGFATARAGNVIGGGDWATDRIIPDAIRSFIDSVPLSVRNPNAIRPWQHVLEPLSGYIMLCQKLYEDPRRYSGPWNFGPADADAKPVSFIANQLAKNWGGNASWKSDSGDHPHEAKYLKLDCSKARNELYWQPRLTLEEALGLTVNWYQAEVGGEDTLAKTREQIAYYQQRLDQDEQ